ncbi:protein of unknown function [Cohaesibacter sp. ES.047]|nr:protein of unknown function [Cohaesibacter sp. ES.047]
MGHPLEHVIEERIREAMEKGDLSDLPNAGKPIANLAESTEDTLARVMREQGGKPAFVLLNGKLQALLTRMTETDDPLARRAIEQQIADLRTKLAIEKERGS